MHFHWFCFNKTKKKNLTIDCLNIFHHQFWSSKYNFHLISAHFLNQSCNSMKMHVHVFTFIELYWHSNQIGKNSKKQMPKNKWVWKESKTNSIEIFFSIPIERLHSNDVNVKRNIGKISPKLLSSKIMNTQLFIRGRGCCANILSCLNIVNVYNDDITARSFVHTFCMRTFVIFKIEWHFFDAFVCMCSIFSTEYIYHSVSVWCVYNVHSQCMPSFHLIWWKKAWSAKCQEKKRRSEEPTTWQSFTSQCNI